MQDGFLWCLGGREKHKMKVYYHVEIAGKASYSFSIRFHLESGLAVPRLPCAKGPALPTYLAARVAATPSPHDPLDMLGRGASECQATPGY